MNTLSSAPSDNLTQYHRKLLNYYRVRHEAVFKDSQVILHYIDKHSREKVISFMECAVYFLVQRLNYDFLEREINFNYLIQFLFYGNYKEYIVSLGSQIWHPRNLLVNLYLIYHKNKSKIDGMKFADMYKFADSKEINYWFLFGQEKWYQLLELSGEEVDQLNSILQKVKQPTISNEKLKLIKSLLYKI